jgi:parvulin-like peptidyl-prolyl isomerase
MKKSSVNWCAAACSVALLALAAHAAAADDAEVSRVVAKVGDEVVTSVELEQFLEPIVRQIEQAYTREEAAVQVARAKQAALKQLVERKLLAAEAKAQELELPPIEVEKQIDNVRSRFATEEDFRASLEERGLSLEEFRTIAEDDLKARVLIQEKVAKRVRVLPSEIHDYYQLHVSEYMQPAQVHMYQILFKKRPDPAAARARAADVLAELDEGASFQQMARLHSEGPKRTDGGDWGLVEQGYFGDEMAAVEQAAFALEPGRHSKLIETKYGFHIVFIDMKRESRTLSEKEAYDDIYRRLWEDKFATVYEDYMQHLRDKTYVEVTAQGVEPSPFDQ